MVTITSVSELPLRMPHRCMAQTFENFIDASMTLLIPENIDVNLSNIENRSHHLDHFVAHLHSSVSFSTVQYSFPARLDFCTILFEENYK